jgi:hypothetical protein
MHREPQFAVELTADNENVEMNEFVQKITAILLWAILKSLRLDKEPTEAVFKVKLR